MAARIQLRGRAIRLVCVLTGANEEEARALLEVARPAINRQEGATLAVSKGQARKDIEGGGAYLNNVRDTNFQRAVLAGDLLFGKYLLLRKGKRNYVVLTAK